MTAPRLLNLTLACFGAVVCAAILSTAHLLDGPTDLEAMADTAASVADAQAAAQATHRQRVLATTGKQP